MKGVEHTPFLLDGGRHGGVGSGLSRRAGPGAGASSRQRFQLGGHTTTQASSIEEEGFQMERLDSAA